MYLSKISLAQTSQAKEALLKLCQNRDYGAHQLLWRLFSDQEKREFLYREQLSSNGQIEFYVFSRIPPAASPEFNIQTKLWSPVLSPGQKLAFKLRVNPTITISSNQERHSRHDVLMHAKYQAIQQGVSDKNQIRQLMFQAAGSWITDKQRMIGWGLSFDFTPDIECYTQHKNTKKNGQVIRFSSLDVQGVLTVRSPDIFIERIINGFGRSKSFGCGLMLIRSL
ncbi:type I-E CRISPR-associated protein Cas6/Cse3/CasE [Legionella sp. CNM-4043-24]|uniref:type I-E CRISPR-associated protein Cas6/Cse3/CasE n=1 Tax=Legionella sp. CNM-4043-24 TaxID=3421646 RepID=UPI00403AD66A